MEEGDSYFLKIENVTKIFAPHNLYIKNKNFDCLKSVDDVSFTIKKGETVGLVGASGSGKSTLGKILVRLLTPTSGKVIYKGLDIFSLTNKQFSGFRKDLQMVFQNSYAALNNMLNVKQILIEGLRTNNICSRNKEIEVIDYLLDLVELGKKDKFKHPSELSGGQCQRVGIARSLLVEPEFIVFDEATSALDVIVQHKIVDVIKKIQKKMNLTYLFISHNIALVEDVADRIAVMYGGKIVEIGPTKVICNNPIHPYTKRLIKAYKSLYVSKNYVEQAYNRDFECDFGNKCKKQERFCEKSKPALKLVEKDHFVICNN